MSTHALFVITGAEVAALHGLGPLAAALYLHLRGWMDYGTGIVGRTRPVSLAMLAAYTESHVPRGGGTQITRPSEKSLRVALDRLTRAGLLTRERSAGLVFRLALAQTGKVRPFQTGHDEGTQLSTEPGSVKATPGMECVAEHGTGEMHDDGLNPTHIRYQEVQNLYAVPALPPVDNFDRREQPATASGNGKPQRQPDRLLGLARGTEDDHERLLRCGRQRGLEPRPGESWAEFAARAFRPAQDGAVSGVQGAQGAIEAPPMSDYARATESRQKAAQAPEAVEVTA